MWEHRYQLNRKKKKYNRNRNFIQQANPNFQINEKQFQKGGKERIKVIKRVKYIRIVETAIFKKAEKKKLKKDNFIQQNIQYEKFNTKNTTRKIQHQQTKKLK